MPEQGEDFQFDDQDLEPQINQEKASQMHLSHNRYLLLLNQSDKKMYFKIELQKLARSQRVCEVEII